MSTKLARPEILSLKEYQSARSIINSGRIFLDANESPNSPFGSLLNRYPEPQPKRLVERLCSIYKVPAEAMMIGRGSDEAIDLLVRVFCEAGKDRILICPPTYGMYEVSANTQGAKVLKVPMILEGIKSRLDENAILKAIEDSLHSQNPVKIVFLCSPNNPTATAFPRDTLVRITKALEGKCIVVVDEAYAEFSSELSMIEAIPTYSNLVVLRTLSKAWASAGIRIGVSLSHPAITQLLQKVRAPYPLSLPAIEAALAATDFERQQALTERVKMLIGERERLTQALLQIKGVKFIYPSATNFILVQFEQHDEIMKKTRAAGIILRDRNSEKGLENCIRITIGTVTENNEVIEIIKEVTYHE